MKCCWDCRRCRSNERLNDDTTGCVECDLFTWPDDVNYTTCVRIPPTYMRWDDPIGIGLAVLGSAGFLSTLFVTWLFINNRNRKVIKGSSRELSGVILIGLFIAFMTAIAFIYKPTNSSCYITFFGFNVSIAAIFAPLFIKTNRVYRLFAAAERCQLRVTLIVAVAILIQVGPRWLTGPTNMMQTFLIERMLLQYETSQVKLSNCVRFDSYKMCIYPTVDISAS